MRSLWLDEALTGEVDTTELVGEHEADVCIAGGGYTGLWTALRVKDLDPGLEVVLLEADVCGGGPSGRNGGMVLSWWAKFRALEQVCGTSEALRLARASAEAVGAVGTFCDRHGIDVRYRCDGWLWSATSPPWIDAWRPTVDRLQELGERPFELLDREEAAARTRSPVQLGGAFETTGAILQPALLARGLARVAREHGVRVFERSPVQALERHGLRTPGGRVTAPRIVLALGAWLAQLRALRRALVVVASDMIATTSIPDRLAELGWSGGLGVSDARPRTEYYRPTADGRIAFGKGGGTLALGGRIGASFNGHAPHEDEVAACLRRVYPALADVPVAASWTGPIDRSRSGLPFFGRLREGVVYGAGYSGRGVAQSYLGGRILASLVLGRHDEWSSCGLVTAPGRFPPEPLRYVGGRVLQAAVAAVERAEDEGRRPPTLAAAAERLAPSGVLPSRERFRRVVSTGL